MSIVPKMYLYFNFPRVLPLYLLLRLSQGKKTIIYDINRWAALYKLPFTSLLMRLNYFLLNTPEFRNVFYLRLNSGKNICMRVAGIFCTILYPKLNTLKIRTYNIGAGLFIQHGIATIISAESIGKDCWINQQVTIGYSHKMERPEIGDNVTIYAGAKIIGKVRVGNNSIIGANAVVVKNVPDDCTVVGVPAYIIKRKGLRVPDEPLL